MGYSWTFFISGAPALLYQIIWHHHLATIYGSYAESVGIIVGAYMFGLGFGSLLGGEVALRFKLSPFYLFAIIESFIALFGFFSLDLFDLVGRISTQFGLFGAGVCAFLLIILPTIAMGATLPILANALISRLKNVGVSVGNLYFVNTLGSACASLGSIFLFVNGFGQHDAIVVAVLLNIFVVLVSFIFLKLSPLFASENDMTEILPESVVSESDAGKKLSHSHLFAGILSFCSGFISLSIEILWFRVLFLSNFGRAFSFPIGLTFFLFGIAFGSLAIARAMGQNDITDPRILQQKASGIMFISGIAISLVFASAGLMAQAGLGVFLFIATVALAFPLGMLFPLLMHAGVLPDIRAGRSVSHIYAANILGATVGSIGTGFILLDHMSLRGITLLLSFISAAYTPRLCRGVSAKEGPGKPLVPQCTMSA